MRRTSVFLSGLAALWLAAVSAYAQPGHRAKHNLNYWQFGDYLGIGAGAHSKLSFPHRVLRQARYKHPRAYMDAMKAANPKRSGRSSCSIFRCRA